MRRRIVRLLAWLVGAWLLPVITNVLRVDWLLPVLIFLLTAAMLRVGRTLLDRLILTGILLIGSVSAAGLLFTFWPWGLAPVVVAGVALSVLGIIDALLARPLQLPKPDIGDGIVTGAAALVLGVFARPYITGDYLGRLALLMAGEDNSRHFSVYDAISRVGGYVFWQPTSAMPDVLDKMLFYPQGWHLTAALLDGFSRSASGAGEIASETSHFLGFVILTYGFLAMTILWAVRWIAGPLLTPWRQMLVTVFVAGMLVFGELPSLLVYGFVSEIFVLAILVCLVAILTRPVGGIRSQVVLMCAAMVAIGFAYQLFLPVAFLMIGFWLYRRRKLVRAHLLLLALLPVSAGIAAITAVLGVLYAGHSKLLAANGGIVPNSRSIIIALAALVGAALLTPAGRRLRAYRAYLASVLAVASLPVAVLAYAIALGSDSRYYYEKTLTAFSVSLLIGVGAVTLFLPRPRPDGWPAGVRAGLSRIRMSRRERAARLSAPASAVLLALAIGSALGLASSDAPLRVARPDAVKGWSSGWIQSRWRPMAAEVTAINQRYPEDPNVINIVLTDGPSTSYLESLFLSMYQRSNGIVGPVVIPVLSVDYDALAEGAQVQGRKIRLIATNSTGLYWANVFQHRFPNQTLTVERL
jgi:hypothetical protein